jgi:hypothetical protein
MTVVQNLTRNFMRGLADENLYGRRHTLGVKLFAYPGQACECFSMSKCARITI